MGLGLDKVDHPIEPGFGIKAKEIAKGAGWWKNNEEKRNKLRELMLSFPSQHGGTSFRVVIDKKKHIDQYAFHTPAHEVAFQYMFEGAWMFGDPRAPDPPRLR